MHNWKQTKTSQRKKYYWHFRTFLSVCLKTIEEPYHLNNKKKDKTNELHGPYWWWIKKTTPSFVDVNGNHSDAVKHCVDVIEHQSNVPEETWVLNTKNVKTKLKLLTASLKFTRPLAYFAIWAVVRSGSTIWSVILAL